MKKKETQSSTLATLIKNGDFTYVNENINTLFKTEPIRGEVKLRNFGKYMTSSEVIAELKKDGCVPANATELLDWYSKNIDWKPESYCGIVALGSVVNFEGDRRVCYVWLDGSERYCNLYWCTSRFSRHCWFAFSRESTGNSDTLAPALGSFEPSVLISEIEERLAKLKTLV